MVGDLAGSKRRSTDQSYHEMKLCRMKRVYQVSKTALRDIKISSIDLECEANVEP